MDKIVLLYYLINIKKTGNIFQMIDKYDISYMDLNDLYSQSLKLKLIISNKGETILTQKGNQEITKLRKELKLKGIDSFTMPYSCYEIEPIDQDYIYVPKSTSFKTK